MLGSVFADRVRRSSSRRGFRRTGQPVALESQHEQDAVFLARGCVLKCCPLPSYPKTGSSYSTACFWGFARHSGSRVSEPSEAAFLPSPFLLNASAVVWLSGGVSVFASREFRWMEFFEKQQQALRLVGHLLARTLVVV